MEITHKCTLEFKMPEERHKLGYAVNGEQYYKLCVEMGDLIRDAMHDNPCLQLVELWDDVRQAARARGVELY